MSKDKPTLPPVKPANAWTIKVDKAEQEQEENKEEESGKEERVLTEQEQASWRNILKQMQNRSDTARPRNSMDLRDQILRNRLKETGKSQER